tara:strand:- start:13175 stop:14137 length:963 start_codon:yes stop_codon:yes gene_type:complete
MLKKIEGNERLKKRLPSKNRLHFFLFFVFISFSFWISTKLSNSYTIEQIFNIEWINIPDSIVISDNNLKLNTSITASGVEIILYRLFNNNLKIDLIQANFELDFLSINLANQKFLIQQQLYSNTLLNQITPSLVKIKFSRLSEKKIPIIPKTRINLRAGYLTDSNAISKPDCILVRGPKILLDSIYYAETVAYNQEDVFKSISRKINLRPIQGVNFSKDIVDIELSVSRYSEKEFNIPIELINKPESVKVKLFPPKTKIRATIPMSVIGNIRVSDFILIADYNQILNGQTQKLELFIQKKPIGVKQIILEPNEVNYLIRK